MESKITTQMKKGVIEYIVLAVIAKGEVYASDIIDILKRNDLILVEGTLYPLLSRLKTEELLNYSRVESVQGPPRKYYRLTEKGTHALQLMRKTRSGLAKTITNIDKVR
ncbi:Transcriptional regulator PadR-like family protein [candidate division SR1 bacterium Aalborg_AAW-1]|nr:Transcriptional regulator PadR-like family protein [candidate division SR1 bacterium Aalborg_AAW-1]